MMEMYLPKQDLLDSIQLYYKPAEEYNTDEFIPQDQLRERFLNQVRNDYGIILRIPHGYFGRLLNLCGFIKSYTGKVGEKPIVWVRLVQLNKSRLSGRKSMPSSVHVGVGEVAYKIHVDFE